MADIKIKVAAVIVAAGDSRRMDGIDKVMASIGGRPVLARVLVTFQFCD
jgi:2-C-methyl-D-erythritol 4-phosphate cytidylyltransferase